jgi:hypothetical protein
MMVGRIRFAAASAACSMSAGGSARSTPASYLRVSAHTDSGVVELLACDGCGQAGRWPLETKTRVSDAAVTWASFGSRTDASGTYAGLGPFGIDKGLYEAAARDAEQELAL